MCNIYRAMGTILYQTNAQVVMPHIVTSNDLRMTGSEKILMDFVEEDQEINIINNPQRTDLYKQWYIN